MRSLLMLLPGMLFGLLCRAQQAELKGQASGWWTYGEQSLTDSRLGLRYIPTFSVADELESGRNLDMELSLNAFSSGPLDQADALSDAKAYRAWFRFTTPRFELRAGLQKIEFGPATMLRSLRWFDRLDPRDPLQLTDGVYGILGRYTWSNNTNLSVWGLYGNDEPKGWELVGSVAHRPEFGYRFQFPTARGEMALTMHHRCLDLGTEETEQRYALDGRWDLAWGLWFEAVAQQANNPFTESDWRQFLTVGVDQTLGLGNGLYILLEHQVLATSKDAFALENDLQLSAFNSSYSLSLNSSISAIGYYNWDTRELTPYLSSALIYDNWSFRLNLFDNPNLLPGPDNRENLGLLPGKGMQLMVIYNH